MIKIKFNPETRTFGIQANTVRKSKDKYYKDKYGVNSDEYKEFKARKDMLDSLESNPSELNRSTGYAKTPDRILKLIKSIYGEGTELPQGYKRSKKLNESDERRKRFVRNHDPEVPNNLFIKAVRAHNSILNKDANKNLNRYYRVGRKKVVTPLLEKEVQKSGIDVYHYPVIDGYASTLDENLKPKGTININPGSNDYTLGHEFSHALNDRWSVSNELGKKLSESKMKTDLSNVTNDLYSPDNIYDYINNVSQEELSANRGMVMNNYIYGGDLMNDKRLKKAYKLSNASQSTYDSFIGGYRPPSLRYNMSPEAIENMNKNKSR